MAKLLASATLVSSLQWYRLCFRAHSHSCWRPRLTHGDVPIRLLHTTTVFPRMSEPREHPRQKPLCFFNHILKVISHICCHILIIRLDFIYLAPPLQRKALHENMSTGNADRRAILDPDYKPTVFTFDYFAAGSSKLSKT